MLVGQVGDGREILGGGRGQPGCGGVAVNHLQHPAFGEVLDPQGQFGEAQRQQVMQLVDQPGPLANHGLEAPGDLTQGPQSGRERNRGGWPFGQREASAGVRLDGVRLPGPEQSGAIVLVALRIAPGQGDASVGDGASRVAGGGIELRQEVQQVVGILASGIDANDEVNSGVSRGEGEQTLAERIVAGGGLGESQFGTGGLQVVAQEAGVVAVTRGVDTDAEANRAFRRGRRSKGRRCEHEVSQKRRRERGKTRESFALVGS